MKCLVIYNAKYLHLTACFVQFYLSVQKESCFISDGTVEVFKQAVLLEFFINDIHEIHHFTNINSLSQEYNLNLLAACT